MAVTVRQNLVPQSKYSIKCPYKMTPRFLTVHNTYNNAPAENEAKYMISNNNQVSFHIVFDDKGGIQCIPFDRNAWHAGDGNGPGNRESIGIEICYSKSGGPKFDAAERNAAQWIAAELNRRNWGIDRVKRHYDWSGKNCPHRTMANGWDRFLKMVESYMEGKTPSATTPATKPSAPAAKKPDVKYQAYAGGKWWADILNYNNSNSNGYAGVIGKPIRGIRANTVGDASVAGKLKLRAHVIGGGWYNWQTDREMDKNGENFAGDLKKNIDGVQMTLTGVKGYKVKYRVHLLGGGWLDWITEYGAGSNGYAGIYGKPIDAIQIQIIKA